MNILQVVSRLDTSDSAEDTIASTRFFMLNGHKVVVASEKSGRVKEIDEVGGRHRAISCRRNIFLIPALIFKLSQIISKENIQVVHARDPVSAFAGFFASRLKDRAFIATVYPPYKKGLFGKSQFWAKRVICFSETEAHRLREDGFVSREKVRVIPPFVVTCGDGSLRGTNDETRPHNDYFTVGAALPLFSSEATQNFIKTVLILSRTVNKLKVFVTDSGPRHEKDSVEKLKLLIKRYSLDNIVTFLSREEAIKTLSGLNLFAQINVNENPYLRFLLQAAFFGVPVVTTSAGWITDYAEDNKKAFSVCETGSPKDMAFAILDLRKNEKLRSGMVKEARKFVREKFDIKKIMESTSVLYENVLSGKKILIIKIGALGDAILAVPSLRAIRERFPKAKIKLLTGVDKREIFMNSPFIDEIIVCDFEGRDRGLGGLLRVAGRLRAEDFDMVIDLQNNKKSHLLSFLSCSPKRYGYNNGKLSFLLNRKVKDTRTPVDPITHQSKTLGLLGIYNIDKRLELWPSKEDERWANNFLKSHWVKKNMKLVAVNIGSSPKWITKLWLPEYFAEVCNRLAREFGIRVVLVGREKDNQRTEKFLKCANCKPINALGKTSIPRLASLAKRCNLLLGSDSAPIHVAACVGTPFVALFGPTDPLRHLAPTAKNSIVFKKGLKCSPCYHTRCDRGYRCMRSIKPDEVYEAILKLLKVKS